MTDRRKLKNISVALDTDTGLSASIDLIEKSPVGIKMESWTAGNLTFQVSHNNSDFGNMYDAAGGEIIVTADTDIFITLDPKDFVGAQYIKIRSGTAGTPVAQAAARELGLIVRRLD
jgi:hypothetical protein